MRFTQTPADVICHVLIQWALINAEEECVICHSEHFDC